MVAESDCSETYWEKNWPATELR